MAAGQQSVVNTLCFQPNTLRTAASHSRVCVGVLLCGCCLHAACMVALQHRQLWSAKAVHSWQHVHRVSRDIVGLQAAAALTCAGHGFAVLGCTVTVDACSSSHTPLTQPTCLLALPLGHTCDAASRHLHAPCSRPGHARLSEDPGVVVVRKLVKPKGVGVVSLAQQLGGGSLWCWWV